MDAELDSSTFAEDDILYLRLGLAMTLHKGHDEILLLLIVH